MDIIELLKIMTQKKAADLFLTVDLPPAIKVNGSVEFIGEQKLNASTIEQLIKPVITEVKWREYQIKKELNCGVEVAELKVRFRVNIFQQKSVIGSVIRRIEHDIPTLESLAMPPILNELILSKKGLIILVGPTGVGKSSTIAAMIGHRNKNTAGHIVTIEDPIEFVHQHAKSIITQREVGLDTDSYDDALQNALRQAPDVILIGEIRNKSTMHYALNFAETGHLCVATLHATNAAQAIDRIIHFFPHDMHKQLLNDLALNLKAIIAQQLIPAINGNKRVPAVEVLLNTPTIADAIKKNDIMAIKGFMAKSRELGMQTFDMALFELCKNDLVAAEHALQYADSENELRLMLKAIKKLGGDGPNLLKDVKLIN